MRAVVFDRCGEPADVLQLRDIPVPEPGPGQVRVRMLMCPVNPSDLMGVRGTHGGALPKLPGIAGREGVGIVEAAGPGLLCVAPWQVPRRQSSAALSVIRFIRCVSMFPDYNSAASVRPLIRTHHPSPSILAAAIPQDPTVC